MDPQATLNAAREAIANGHGYEALPLLNDYSLWRERGGFEPTNEIGVPGDKQHAALLAALNILTVGIEDL